MPEEMSRELQKMRDTELAEFIRETIARLHIVADHLETYVTTEEHRPEVGFEVPNLKPVEQNDATAQ